MTREDVRRSLRPVEWDGKGNGWVELSDGFYLAFQIQMYDSIYYTGAFIGEVQKISEEIDNIPEGGLSPVQDEGEEATTYEEAKQACADFYLNLICNLLQVTD